jgi:hypothetical protein
MRKKACRVDAITVLRRCKFRGCREVLRKDGVAVVVHGQRRTTVPMFTGDVPRELIAWIEHELDIDLRRPPIPRWRRDTR